MTPQERHIERCRELLQPSPVRVGHVPRWLARRIRERTPCRGHGTTLLGKALALAQARFDHEGSTVLPDGREAFVSETYELLHDIDGARRFAALLGLELRVSACSWWFPGYAIRVAFTLA